jgi:hypothetical protein
MEALGRACHPAVFLKWVGRCFAKSVVDFAQTSRAKFWEPGEEVGKKTPDCLSSVLVKQRFWLGQAYRRQS